MQGGGAQHWADTDNYSVITVMAALVFLDSILHSALFSFLYFTCVTTAM